MADAIQGGLRDKPEELTITRLLPYAIALSLSVPACAPIKSEVRETVIWSGPLETYRSPTYPERTPVVVGLPTDSSLDIRVELVQRCRQESRRNQRIRRETIKTAEPYFIGTEIVAGLGLSALPAWACLQQDCVGKGGDVKLPFAVFPLAVAGSALLIAAGVDIARSRDSVKEVATVKSHTEVLQCVSQPAGPIPIVVRFSDGTRVDTALDQAGTVSVPIPTSLLSPEAVSAFAEVGVGGAWRSRIPIPRRER